MTARDTGFFSNQKNGAVASIAIVTTVATVLGAAIAAMKRFGKKQA